MPERGSLSCGLPQGVPPLPITPAPRGHADDGVVLAVVAPVQPLVLLDERLPGPRNGVVELVKDNSCAPDDEDVDLVGHQCDEEHDDAHDVCIHHELREDRLQQANLPQKETEGDAHKAGAACEHEYVGPTEAPKETNERCLPASVHQVPEVLFVVLTPRILVHAGAAAKDESRTTHGNKHGKDNGEFAAPARFLGAGTEAAAEEQRGLPPVATVSCL
mmetsp:Transcript_80987/g.241328  ORF Transcript_80987/g.241328 Transcript_80987/m.241328 type:complete len:218 (+) Transcript_80987:131-784(+)